MAPAARSPRSPSRTRSGTTSPRSSTSPRTVASASGTAPTSTAGCSPGRPRGRPTARPRSGSASSRPTTERLQLAPASCYGICSGALSATKRPTHGGEVPALRDLLGRLVDVRVAERADGVEHVVVHLRAADEVRPRGRRHGVRHVRVVLEQELVVAGCALELLVEQRLELIARVLRRPRLVLD